MAISTQNFFGVTLNCDITSTSTASNPYWTNYRDAKIGASTWGILPFSTEYFIGTREGQANNLPTNGAGTWTPPPWFADLHSTSVCPWYRPKGLRNLHSDLAFPVSKSTNFGSSDWLWQIKWKVGKVASQSTPGFIWGMLPVNEPEKLYSNDGSQIADAVGGDTAGLLSNLVLLQRACLEQLVLSTTGSINSATTCLHRSTDIVMIGPSLAEPVGTAPANAWSIYDLFQNTTYIEYVDCISAHHHQGMGNYGLTYGFNATAPSSAAGQISIYHLHRAKETSPYSTWIRPHIYDESGLSMTAPLHSLIGWTATNSSTFPNLVDYSILDELRRLRTGSMIAGMLQWAPSLWYTYAFETGASDYLFDVQSSTQSVYPGWTATLTMSDWRLYRISALTTSDGRTIPIPAKGSTDLSYLPTFSVRVDTNRNTQSSYGSPTPAFSQWSQSSFTSGLIKLTSGSTKLVDMYVSFDTTSAHTFAARVAVTGSTLGGVRLRAMGYHNWKGHSITQSSVAWGGESTQTLLVTVSPTFHGDSRVPGDPGSALFSIMHNGIGTVFIDQVQIYASATTVCPYIWDYGAAAVQTDADNSTLAIAFPTTYVAGSYFTLYFATRSGPKCSGASFPGISNWTLIRSTYGAGAPSVFVYGKFASSTDTGNINVTFQSSTAAGIIAKGRCVSWLGVSTETPFESATARRFASLAAATTYYTCDFYQLDTYRTAVALEFINTQIAPMTWTGAANAYTDAGLYNSSTNELGLQLLYSQISDAGLQTAAAWEGTGTNLISVGFNLIAGSTEVGLSADVNQTFAGLSVYGSMGMDQGVVLQQTFGGLSESARMGQDLSASVGTTFGGLALRRGSAVLGPVTPSGVNPNVYGFHMRGHRRIKASKFTVK